MRSSTGRILFKDGQVFTPPDIDENNGWYYRPSIVAGHKTFGRSSEGRRQAEVFLRECLTKLPHTNPDMIASIEREKGAGAASASHAYLQIATHGPLGWTDQSWRLAGPRSVGNPWTLQISRHDHAVARELNYHTLYGDGKRGLAIESSTPLTDRESVVKNLRALVRSQGLESLRPTDDYEDLGDRKVRMNNEFFWWLGDSAPRAIVVQNFEGLADMFKAYSHFGVQVSIEAAWNYGGYRGYGEGAEIRRVLLDLGKKSLISQDPDHNQFGHSLKFEEKGITIKCGFVEHEERWIEHQKRMAVEDLKTMINDTTPETFTITPTKGT